MDDPRRNPNPLFTLSAWASLVVPVLSGGVTFLASSRPMPDHPRGLPTEAFVALAVACGVGLLAGCVSLAGVKRNGAWVILPPAILGILASVAVLLLALLFAGLSSLPGP